MLAALTGSPLRSAAERKRWELPAPSGACLPCAALPSGHAALPPAPQSLEGQVSEVVRWSLASPASPSPGGSLCASTRLLKAWAIAGVGGGGGNVRVTLQADDAKKVLVKHAARGCLVTDLAVAAAAHSGGGGGGGGGAPETESEVLASADSAGVVSVTLVSVLAFDGSLVATPLLEVETDCGDGGSEAAPTLLRWHPSELGALFIARGGCLWLVHLLHEGALPAHLFGGEAEAAGFQRPPPLQRSPGDCILPPVLQRAPID